MASQRMSYTTTSPIGAKLARVAQLGSQFRQAVMELHNDVEDYNDNNTQLETDLGNAPSGTGATLRGLLNFAQAELYGQTINDIPANSQTSTRQLLDQTA